MKKFFVISSLFILLFTGCTTANTPSRKVEDFLGRYQSMDSDVLTQLDNVVANDSNMSDEQKKDYKSLMERQYQNMSYKIKNEEINGDNATVEVEIEVYDYATSIAKSKKYYEEHKDEFKDNDKDTTNNNVNNNNTNNNANNNNKDNDNDKDNDNNNVVEDVIESSSKYIDYKIKELKDVVDKVKYTITFNLHREDNTWKLDDISDVDRKKLHGLYEE